MSSEVSEKPLKAWKDSIALVNGTGYCGGTQNWKRIKYVGF